MHIGEPSLQAPVRTPETEAFWNAANKRELIYAQCNACGRPHAYPRRICPFCLSPDVSWNLASGYGEIYAFSLFRRGRPEYVSAWVMLREGAAILTNLVDCETDMLAIGMPVRVVYRPTADGQLAPVFEPI